MKTNTHKNARSARKKCRITNDFPAEFASQSRKLLRLANLGIPRIEFLKEISAILHNLSQCDALELWVQDGELLYSWTAHFNEDAEFGFRIIPPVEHEQHCAAKAMNLNCLVWNIFLGNTGQKPPYFTRTAAS